LPETSAQLGTASLTKRIHASYGALPEREARIADLLLQHPEGLAAYTATEVAQQAGVSKATVTRFFRRLGFDSFDAARQAVRRLLAAGSPLYRLPGKAAGSEFLSAILTEDIAVLEATLCAINPVTLREIAAALGSARRVKIAGFRNSQAFAQYLAAGLSQLRPDCVLMPAPAQSMAEELAQLCADDLVVLVGLRRRPAGFNALVEAAADTGARLLLITDSTVRAAPAHARWTLNCVVGTSEAFDSYSGTVALIRTLVLSVGKQLSQDGSRHLESVEAFHEKLSDLE
jgi:DNA-binding MurR/RpiR family transcriptional regulator